MNQLWEQALEKLKDKVSLQSFKVWIEPAHVLSMTDNIVELSVTNDLFQEMIHEKNLASSIKEVLHELTGRPYDLRFKTIKETQASPSAASSVDATSANNVNTEAHPQILVREPRPSMGDTLNPKYTFENFVVGSSNQFSHAASYAAAEQPGGSYNPLFIFGGVGLGKTHLLNAIGNHILKKNPSARVCYIASERFMNELINSLRYEKMPDFRRKYRDQCDVLLMDDIQFIAGKERTQEEFFHTFNTLHGSRRQIVVTSDQFPKDIKGLEERLRTRFEWGLIADIQPPEMETRIAILKNKAESDDIYLPDDVAIYLATNIKSNVRELEGSLIRMGAFASLTGLEVSVDLAKEVLKNIIQPKSVTLAMEDIQKNVADFYNIKVIDLKSKKKLKTLSHPRQVAMYLCRKYTQKSFPEIGKLFGGKDHSTVMHAVRKISQMMSTDPVFKKDLDSIERIVESQNC